MFTLEEILAGTTAAVPCPRLGEGTITVRRISSAEYLRCYPPPLESVPDEPAEARTARETEWRKLHAEALEEVVFRLVAVAAVAPPLTLEQARGLGDEAAAIGRQVLALYDASQAGPDAA